MEIEINRLCTSSTLDNCDYTGIVNIDGIYIFFSILLFVIVFGFVVRFFKRY